MAGEKKCFMCGADSHCLDSLNARGEFKGGVERFYYRCAVCKQYFVEIWINGAIKTVLGS